MSPDAPITLSTLATEIGAELTGPPGVGDRPVSTCAALDAAEVGEVSFLSNPKYAKQLETTRASAVVVSPGTRCDANPNLALLHARNPYYAFALAAVRLHGYRRHPHTGIHPRAYVDATAIVGEGTTIYPGAFVGPRVSIGRDCILYPNVVVYDDTSIGDRVILHAGCVIGADGYGYATHKAADSVIRHFKIPQVGVVVLEDDVEIGANAAVDRAALGITLIATGTKLDNLVTIGHGVQIGAHCLIVAQTGIAGSTTLGHHVTMAGQVGVAGHLKIGEGSTFAAKTGVMADVEAGATMLGVPAMPASRARRVYAGFLQLPEVIQRLRDLERLAAGEVDKPGPETV